jgi:hypothetical protein
MVGQATESAELIFVFTSMVLILVETDDGPGVLQVIRKLNARISCILKLGLNVRQIEDHLIWH